MGMDERWVSLGIGRVDGAYGERMLVKLETADDGRARATTVVLFADPVDSRFLKSASGLIGMTVDFANASVTMVDHAELPKAMTRALDTALGRAREHQATLPTGTTTRRTRPPLTRPDGTDPDGFARRVAEAYADAVAARQSPAEAIREEADVPLATARGWIREARRRGALAPGRPNRRRTDAR